MTVVLTTLFLCLTVVAVVVLTRSDPPTLVADTPTPPLSILDERLLDYVIVTAKSGATFGGVLYVEDDGALVLAKAEQISRDGTKTQADGEIIILRADVDFIQRP